MTKNERRKDSSFQGLGNWPAWFFSVFTYGSQSDLASPKLAGREFELAEATNKVTNGSAVRMRPGSTSNARGGGERSEIRLGGSGITRAERKRGIGAFFTSKHATEPVHLRPTSFSLAAVR